MSVWMSEMFVFSTIAIFCVIVCIYIRVDYNRMAKINKEISIKIKEIEKMSALIEINKHKARLTEQQYKVLMGLAKSGDSTGALKGLHKILRRNGNGKTKAD